MWRSLVGWLGLSAQDQRNPALSLGHTRSLNLHQLNWFSQRPSGVWIAKQMVHNAWGKYQYDEQSLRKLYDVAI
jgi:hypothetical protein